MLIVDSCPPSVGGPESHSPSNKPDSRKGGSLTGIKRHPETLSDPLQSIIPPPGSGYSARQAAHASRLSACWIHDIQRRCERFAKCRKKRTHKVLLPGANSLTSTSERDWGVLSGKISEELGRQGKVDAKADDVVHRGNEGAGGNGRINP